MEEKKVNPLSQIKMDSSWSNYVGPEFSLVRYVGNLSRYGPHFEKFYLFQLLQWDSNLIHLNKKVRSMSIKDTIDFVPTQIDISDSLSSKSNRQIPVYLVVSLNMWASLSSSGATLMCLRSYVWYLALFITFRH